MDCQQTEISSLMQLREMGAAEMAVTAAQARQALTKRGYQAGELAGYQQEDGSVRRSFPTLLIRRVLQSRLRAPC